MGSFCAETSSPHTRTFHSQLAVELEKKGSTQAASRKIAEALRTRKFYLCNTCSTIGREQKYTQAATQRDEKSVRSRPIFLAVSANTVIWKHHSRPGNGVHSNNMILENSTQPHSDPTTSSLGKQSERYVPYNASIPVNAIKIAAQKRNKCQANGNSHIRQTLTALARDTPTPGLGAEKKMWCARWSNWGSEPNPNWGELVQINCLRVRDNPSEKSELGDPEDWGTVGTALCTVRGKLEQASAKYRK
ncbi:hypothetical protein C8R45DRAFT_948200 [Mycena sanguinolenta]|nr:hypothetical protein C8R45DRAFT_948200 [Mycena sanguinolenta]